MKFYVMCFVDQANPDMVFVIYCQLIKLSEKHLQMIIEKNQLVPEKYFNSVTELCDERTAW